MTPDEGRLGLATAREQYGVGHWDDLYATTHGVHEARVLDGAELGELAFYLGEACLGRGRAAEAVPYLEEAVRLGDATFSPWAEEELGRARQPGGTADAAAVGASGVDVSDHPELRLGSPERDWVAHAQAKLAHLRYYAGRIDGLFGPVTEAAVKEFQEYWGQPADGVVGQATWAALETAAPGITGTPGQAGHGQHPQGGGTQPALPEDEGAVQFPDDQIEGTTAPEQHWQPLTPDLDTPDAPGAAPVETGPISLNQEFEIALKAPVDTAYGPVKIKDLQLKLSGKLSTNKADAVSVSGVGGAKESIKIETAKWEMLDLGGDWKATLKGSADINASGGLAAVMEVTNGSANFDVKFTVVKFDKGELAVSELSVTGGAKFDYAPIQVGDDTMYFSGKAMFGPTLVPNIPWLVEKGIITATEAAATGAAAAEGTIATGAGAVGAGELIITTGFVAVAIAQLYVAYANINDIEALKQMQDDAPKAVDDFAAGFVSAWAGSAPSGFWGETGASAGRRQFEADVRSFATHIEAEAKKPERTDLAGLVVDEAFLESVRQQWRTTAAEKDDAFRGVVEAMYGKMVRTAVVQAFLKAHPISSLPGDHVRNSYTYGGIPDGPVGGPDTQAGHAAARNANMQLDIDRWQQEWEDQYGN